MIKKLPFSQKLADYLGELFAFLPFTPNQITVFTLILALIGFYFASVHLAYYSFFFFFLSGGLDAIDGAVARAKKMVTAKGAYIDGVIDRLVEFLFVLSFFFFFLPDFIFPAYFLLILILFFGSCMTSFATAYAEHRKVADEKKIASQPGILPRTERLLLLFSALLFIPTFPLVSSFFLFVAALLSAVTFAQRFFYFAG